MKSRRVQFMIATGLLLLTGFAGFVGRGVGSQPPPPPQRIAAAGNGPVSFTGTLDRTAVLRGADGVVRLELVMAGAASAAESPHRHATDLVVVLDRSGSMSGEKIDHARAAVRELLAQLTTGDRFALVTYSTTSEVPISLTTVDDGTRAELLGRLAAVTPDGGTNVSSGLDRAFALIEANRQSDHVPHMLLISDGLANQGDASPEGLRRRAARAAQGEFMLSTVGVGTDFNEQLMTSLADAGTGNYYYVQNTNTLSDVFAREFQAARETIASGLAVEIHPAPGVRVLDAAGYPIETHDGQVTFHPGSLFAGQQRRVWVTLAVPHAVLGEADLGVFALSYGNGATRAVLNLDALPKIACVAGEGEFYDHVEPGAWGRAVIVDSYNKMQDAVARQVQAGDRDGAIKSVEEFRADAERMNAHLSSPAVSAQLKEADKLKDNVAAAFNGPGQERQRNELSKAASAQALDARRAGSKK